ncbi:MAG: 30S ribosomal protein S20 [Syntrophobacterales bacterium]|nr:30S ribosomal protein S20 [Syntrophobacterales bacterium]
MRKNKSAVKKARQSEQKRLRNFHVKSTMKTYIKKIYAVMENKDTEHVDEAFKKAVSFINRAASKGVIHSNNASRKVSRLSKKVHTFLNKA